MSRHDPAHTRAWAHAGTALLLNTVARLDDAAFARPSVLRGWSRAHVVAHVARNAEALGRLAAWARTGVATPMYAGPQQRAAQIEESARRAPSRLRAELRSTAADLDTALDRLDERAWRATVRNALGHEIPATEVAWMRVREVWLHAVDLDAGVRPADLPAGVLDLLLDDVTAAVSGREGCPALHLQPRDRDRSWTLGPAHATSPALRGSAAALVGWLTGRTGGTELEAVRGLDLVPVPAAPPWI